jgi:hypothetical protein
MKKLLTLAILASASVGIAYASGWVSVCALISKVVLEPNAEKPTRVQIWGVFELTNLTGQLDPPRRGYLYFTLPPQGTGENADELARREWNDLKSVAGTRQVVTFGVLRLGALYPRPTVRKPDQKPANPDPYELGTGVAKLTSDTNSEGGEAAAGVPLKREAPMTRISKWIVPVIAVAISFGVANASGWIAVYALIDKVVLEPNSDKPTRVQIWGVFRLAGSDTPRRGYLYFGLPPLWAGGSKEEEARKEWNDLKSTAGKRQVVAFGEVPFGNLNGNSMDGLASVHGPDQKPEKPDMYTFGTGVAKLSSDTDYPPVKSLLEFR